MAIDVRGVTKTFGRLRAVDDLSFAAAEGRVTGFLGPNGAGKSTTLAVLAGLVRPDAGTATIDGLPLAQLPDPARTVGVALDPTAHHPDRSGRDHLRALALAARLPASRVDDVLALVELDGAGRRRAGGYSLGMRQRLHLAAALLGDPATLVLDEPANGLDPQGIRWLRDFLRTLARQGRTVLLSSHQLGEVAATVDDVVIITSGRLVATGPLGRVLDTGPPELRVHTSSKGAGNPGDSDGGSPGQRGAAAEELAGRLRAVGAGVQVEGESLRVVGATAEQVARIALDAQLLLVELTAVEPDLEARFFELTDTAAATATLHAEGAGR